jgi:hypothetical protein
VRVRTALDREGLEYSGYTYLKTLGSVSCVYFWGLGKAWFI